MISYERKRLFKKGNRKWFWVCITVFFIFYLLIVGGATYSDISSELSLLKFDLNGDGFFNGNEVTPELKKEMKNMISDTGINFSFISGLFVSGIFSLTIYASGLFLKRLRKRV